LTIKKPDLDQNLRLN